MSRGEFPVLPITKALGEAVVVCKNVVKGASRRAPASTAVALIRSSRNRLRTRALSLSCFCLPLFFVLYSIALVEYEIKGREDKVVALKNIALDFDEGNTFYPIRR